MTNLLIIKLRANGVTLKTSHGTLNIFPISIMANISKYFIDCGNKIFSNIQKYTRYRIVLLKDDSSPDPPLDSQTAPTKVDSIPVAEENLPETEAHKNQTNLRDDHEIFKKAYIYHSTELAKNEPNNNAVMLSKLYITEIKKKFSHELEVLFIENNDITSTELHKNRPTNYINNIHVSDKVK
jgi:hypothetical protein